MKCNKDLIVEILKYLEKFCDGKTPCLVTKEIVGWGDKVNDLDFREHCQLIIENQYAVLYRKAEPLLDSDNSIYFLRLTSKGQEYLGNL